MAQDVRLQRIVRYQGDGIAVDFVRTNGVPGFSHEVRMLVNQPGAAPVLVARDWFRDDERLSARVAVYYLGKHAAKIAAARADGAGCAR